MKETRYFYVPHAATSQELPADEAQHALRVLRLAEGDTMVLMDGEGCFYDAQVAMNGGKRCLYNIRQTLPQEQLWRGKIHLAIAPTKMMERMEWMVEKATEVGFDSVSFLHCKFSERKQIRTDRVEKIVVSAMKQSRKPWKPTVNDLQPFKTYIETPREGRKFICHCYDEVERKDLYRELQAMPADEAVTVLVGPEGDFAIDEVRLAMANGYESVSLGNARLRTKTAGLVAVTIAQLTKRNERMKE